MDQHTAYGAHTPAIEQLDLTAHGVLGHFAKSSRNAALVKFLISMDRLDRWAVDFDEDASGQQFEIQLLVQELQAFIEAYAGPAPRAAAIRRTAGPTYLFALYVPGALCRATQ